MGYRWEHQEDLEDAVRRIATEQTEKAVDEIDDAEIGLHESIHQLRKRCKKVRGLLRLARPGLASYKQENVFYRDLARRFSDLRDLAAMEECLEALTQAFELDPDAAEFAEVREWLQDRKAALATSMDAPTALQDARQALTEHRADIDGWRVEGAPPTTAQEGATKSYRRARQAMLAATSHPSPERFHEWRKRAKYHRFHLRLLVPAWPSVLDGLRQEARDVSDWLGDDHDLAVLRALIDENDATLGAPVSRSALLAMLRQRSADLRNAAISTGRRLFADPARSFGPRLETLLDAWGSDQLTEGIQRQNRCSI